MSWEIRLLPATWLDYMHPRHKIQHSHKTHYTTKQIRYITNHGIKSLNESNSCILTWWIKHCPTISRVLWKIPIDVVKTILILSENQFGLKEQNWADLPKIWNWTLLNRFIIESIHCWIDSPLNRFMSSFLETLNYLSLSRFIMNRFKAIFQNIKTACLWIDSYVNRFTIELIQHWTNSLWTEWNLACFLQF